MDASVTPGGPTPGSPPPGGLPPGDVADGDVAHEDGTTRRAVLGAAGAASLAAVATYWFDGFGDVARRRRVEPTPPGGPARGLSVRQWRTLAAAQDRLLPSSQGSPGAAATNTIGYLDALMAGSDISEPSKNLIRQGAQRLDRSGRWYARGSFDALEPWQQDGVLRGFERDVRFGLPWLRKMITYLMEGFFGDPVHGGNRGELAWKSVNHRPGWPRPTEPGFRMEDQGE